MYRVKFDGVLTEPEDIILLHKCIHTRMKKTNRLLYNITLR